MRKENFIFEDNRINYIYFYDLSSYNRSDIVQKIHHILRSNNQKIYIIQTQYYDHIVYDIYVNYKFIASIKEYLNKYGSKFNVIKNNTEFKNQELIKFIKWLIELMYDKSPEMLYEVKF